jgi:hypothetical protein
MGAIVPAFMNDSHKDKRGYLFRTASVQKAYKTKCKT